MSIISSKYRLLGRKIALKQPSLETQNPEGFSLIETAIALTTLGICLAYAMPLFLFAKINNSKSEIRTGALIVAQRKFDNIRGATFASMPLSDGQTRDNADPNLTNPGTTWKTGGNSDGTNPVVQPADLGTITDREKQLTYAMGRQYRTKVKYCSGYTTDPSVCSDKYKGFIVEVYYNGSKVYDLQGTYTKFQ